MKKKNLKFLLILINLISLRVSMTFGQHCFIYEDQKWLSNSVTFNINSNLGDAFATHEEYVGAINAADASWNYAGANFEFIYGNDFYAYERGQEPTGFYQVGEYYTNMGNPVPFALTDIYVNPINQNEIVKVETYLNNTYYFFSTDPDYTEFDIQSVTLHEFGHWLRLLDETEYACYENVMYLGLQMGDTKRNLTQDDKNGIVYIYGQNPTIQLTINPLLNRQPFFFEYAPEVLSKIVIEKNSNNSEMKGATK